MCLLEQMLGKRSLLFIGLRLTRENVHVVVDTLRSLDDLPRFRSFPRDGFVRRLTHLRVAITINSGVCTRSEQVAIVSWE